MKKTETETIAAPAVAETAPTPPTEKEVKDGLLRDMQDRCSRVAPLVQKARERAEKLRQSAKDIDIAAGNLEGAIITARDIVRHDPLRAGERLKEAVATFQKAAGSFPELK